MSTALAERNQTLVKGRASAPATGSPVLCLRRRKVTERARSCPGGETAMRRLGVGPLRPPFTPSEVEPLRTSRLAQRSMRRISLITASRKVLRLTKSIASEFNSGRGEGVGEAMEESSIEDFWFAIFRLCLKLPRAAWKVWLRMPLANYHLVCHRSSISRCISFLGQEGWVLC